MKPGSVDSLNVCGRCGARAHARQILETVDCDPTVAAAVDADRVRRDPEPPRHFHHRMPLRALQHDPRPLSQGTGRRTTP